MLKANQGLASSNLKHPVTNYYGKIFTYGDALMQTRKYPPGIEERRDSVILNPGWPGLGDALQFSTLPEQFWVQKRKPTFLHEDYSPSNPQISSLVWLSNPYIAGVSDKSANAGHVIEYSNPTGNFISNWEYLHGLSPVNLEPKIYVQTTPLVGDNLTVIDLNSSAVTKTKYAHNPRRVAAYLEKLASENPSDKFLSVVFSSREVVQNLVQESIFLGKGFETVIMSSIFDYVNLIRSAKQFIGLHSGGVALAAAIKRHHKSLSIKCLVSPKLEKSAYHRVQLNHVHTGVEYIKI
jgi:hypothetical protein